MKSILVISSKPEISFEISSTNLANIVSDMADIDENASIWDVLAKHPSIEVRQALAYKEKLSEQAAQTLLQDNEVNVLRGLVNNTKAKEILTTDELLTLIKRDVEIAESIAGNVDSYSDADQNELCKVLAAHSDPKVRTALAGNSRTSKKVLKAFLQDDDVAVKQAAKQSIEYS